MGIEWHICSRSSAISTMSEDEKEEMGTGTGRKRSQTQNENHMQYDEKFTKSIEIL